MKTIRIRRAAGLLVSVLVILSALESAAQHDGASATDVPDVPSGGSAIVLQLEHPGGAAATEGSAVVLYSLTEDGVPGIRSAQVDAEGRHRFEGISNASGIVYMVGARFADVPYGERVRFDAGQQQIAVTIAVASPASDTSGIRVGESSLRLEWIGTNLAVQEEHQLINTTSLPVLVPKEAREGGRPAFRIRLPEGVEKVDTTASGLPDGFEQRGRELLFWGPVYPTGQQLRYRYLLPAPESEESVRWQLLSGSGRVSLLHPQAGPKIRGEGLTPGPEVPVGDALYQSLDAGPAAPGEEMAFFVDLPEVKNDPSAIRLPRVDAWVEIDDTFQQVTLELQLEVAPGSHLAGSLDQPLLHFELPDDAELRGLSPESQALGVIPGALGGMDLVGPLSPGDASFSYRYRVPIHGRAAGLDLAFPADVGHLNVLIADTGLVIGSDRLHRRRPFRSGTRVFMHREAFQVARGERVGVSLEPIAQRGASRAMAIGSTILVAAAGLWFVFAPLGARLGRAREGADDDVTRSERELLLESIRDLDHDFETGKLEQADYQRMRQEMRSRALVLMQRERDGAAADETATDEPAAADSGVVRFCPGCGQQAQASWKFCVQCGGAIPEAVPSLPADKA